jgi:SOS-response transcriptional repressor LexA
MSTTKTDKQDKLRPTKKQRETLTFIEGFIKQHGYSPSYREIMTGCNYTSVATVALHVNNLIKRGHLQKRDNSARSLEVVAGSDLENFQSNAVSDGEEKWLVKKIEYYFKQAESQQKIDQSQLDVLYVLTGALKALQLDGAANSFIPRLSELKEKVSGS